MENNIITQLYKSSEKLLNIFVNSIIIKEEGQNLQISEIIIFIRFKRSIKQLSCIVEDYEVLSYYNINSFKLLGFLKNSFVLISYIDQLKLYSTEFTLNEISLREIKWHCAKIRQYVSF